MQVKYWSVETLGIFIPYFCSKARKISSEVGLALVVVLIISTQGSDRKFADLLHSLDCPMK